MWTNEGWSEVECGPMRGGVRWNVDQTPLTLLGHFAVQVCRHCPVICGHQTAPAVQSGHQNMSHQAEC